MFRGFPDGDLQERLAWADQQLPPLLGATARAAAEAYLPGMPEKNKSELAATTVKTGAFGIALTIGEIQNTRRLVDFGAGVVGMYFGNDSIDGGGQAADDTMEAIASLRGGAAGGPPDPRLQARRRAVGRISAFIEAFAAPEDRAVVNDCFYGQVLDHEVKIQQLSRGYTAATDKQAFLAAHGTQLAEYSTISAGFPSISSGLYSIYWQENQQLPPLHEIYRSQPMVRLLQVCNVFARLLDDLGDWRKDMGDPAKNTFVLTPFTRYHHAIVERYGELAGMPEKQRAKLDTAIRDFHTDPAGNGASISNLLCAHLNHYMDNLPAPERTKFRQYITLCRRVAEIALVNAAGDDALRPQQ